MRIKFLSLLFGAAALAFGSDCDGSFTLDSTHLSVIFNNQSRACFNWQVSYFSAGFSAVSVQFESAPNGANANVPGTWAAFAGTTLSGSNPNTAITQATSTFSGSFPWVRIRLVSSTGTGQITGRMLGAQLTSAVQFNSPFNPGFSQFGAFTVPSTSAFSWVDQGTNTQTNSTNGIVNFASAQAPTATRGKLCTPIGFTAPWTVISAVLIWPGEQNAGSFAYDGSLLRESGTAEEEYMPIYPGLGGTSTFTASTLLKCPGATNVGCTTVYADSINLQPLVWLQVVDNGVTRVYKYSADGSFFMTQGGSTNPALTVAGADYAAIVPDQFCFYAVTATTNYSTAAKLVSFQSCGNSTGVC